MILRVANKEITCLFRLVDRISVGTDKRPCRHFTFGLFGTGEAIRTRLRLILR
jgi:hypothetical protein